jgi:hypothetical protein
VVCVNRWIFGIAQNIHAGGVVNGMMASNDMDVYKTILKLKKKI